MKKTLFIFFCFVLTFSLMADGLIHQELQDQMNKKDVEELPIIVLFENLPTLTEVIQEYRFMGEKNGVEEAINVLKQKAEALHFWVEQISHQRKNSDFRSIWIANAAVMKATPEMIQEIACQQNVSEILWNKKVHMLPKKMDMHSPQESVDANLTWGLEKINAPAVWNQYTGKGVVVAVIDTGVNEHPDLAGRIIDGKNYDNANLAPRDDHGHGTHCAGTVAGNGTNGEQTGVASEAMIYAVKVLGKNGSGEWSTLWEAMEECIGKAKVISMSLGGNADASIRTRLELACQNVIAAGIIPVIAAGNEGSGAATISSPGDVEDAITVGATSSSDGIAYFSSRGPAEWNGKTYIKPDVCAPGMGIKSCNYHSGTYTSKSGTSMATPHVAGTVALMAQANPNITTQQAKSLLEKTAVDLGTTGKDNTFGAGRIDVKKVMEATESLVTLNESDAKFEMVVKELTFTTTIDSEGNLFLTDKVEYDVMAATVTIWVNVREKEAQKGVYKVAFTLDGPNGSRTGNVTLDFANLPTNENLYNSKYGFNVGNVSFVKGMYTGTVQTTEPTTHVKNMTIHLDGKATWPPRSSR